MRISSFIFIVMVACTSKKVTMEELRHYVAKESNGLTKKVVFENYDCILTYRPQDMLLNQIMPDSCVADSVKEKLAKPYKDKLYFDMVYNTNGKELAYGLANTYADYAELLKRSSYRMGEYVYVTCEKDTTLLMDAYTTNFYGLGAKTHILLVFSEEGKKGKTFEINVRDILGRETQRQVSFNYADIVKIPSVEFCKK